MDREKVIKELQFALDGCDFTKWMFAQVEKQTVIDAIELLKVQEPIPTYEHHGLIHCGGCDHVLIVSGKKPNPYWKYCAYCGRQVKWDD